MAFERNIQGSRITGNIDIIGLTASTFSASTINSNNINNEIIIKAVTDFPTPVSSIIPLAANITYKIKGTISLGGNQISAGTSNVIYGNDKSDDRLIYTGTSSMIIGNNKDLSINNITLAATTSGGTIFSLSGSTNKMEFKDLIIGSSYSLGNIFSGNTIIFRDNLITACFTGLTIQGTITNLILSDNIWIDNLSTFTSLRISSANISTILISRNLFSTITGQTGLNISSGITIGNGNLTNCIFKGSGTSISNFNHNTTGWLFTGNQGIPNRTREMFISNTDITPLALATPTTAAATTAFLSNTGARFISFQGGANVQNGAAFSMQIPSDYYSGGVFNFFTTNDSSPSGNIKLFMGLSKVAVGDNFATLDESPLSVVFSGITTQYSSIESTIMPVTTTFTNNDVIVVKIWRDTADAQDTVGNTINCYLNNVQFVYNSI